MNILRRNSILQKLAAALSAAKPKGQDYAKLVGVPPPDGLPAVPALAAPVAALPTAAPASTAAPAPPTAKDNWLSGARIRRRALDDIGSINNEDAVTKLYTGMLNARKQAQSEGATGLRAVGTLDGYKQKWRAAQPTVPLGGLPAPIVPATALAPAPPSFVPLAHAPGGGAVPWHMLNQSAQAKRTAANPQAKADYIARQSNANNSATNNRSLASAYNDAGAQVVTK